MASVVDTVVTAAAPSTMSTVDDRATYRAESVHAAVMPASVGSVHTAAVGSDITYVSGCGCCPTGCFLTPCIQCLNGYGPRVINLVWTHNNPPNPPSTVGVVWWSNGAKIRSFFTAVTLTATGDCVWEGTFGTPGFEYGSSWYTGYLKLFYDFGWKVTFDYIVPPGLTPSGNGVTFTLDSLVACESVYQDIPITQSDGPPAPITLLSTWTLNGSDAGSAIPASVRLYTCGNATVDTPNCSADRIPFRMTLSFVGCPALATEAIVLDYAGGGVWSSNGSIPSGVGLVIDYNFRVSCEKYPTAGDPYTWVMRVYDLTTGGTLVFTGAATSAATYPVHLTFASAGLHFPNYSGGDLCNGVAFTMHVTV